MRSHYLLVTLVSLCALVSPVVAEAQVAESVFWSQDAVEGNGTPRIGKVDLYGVTPVTLLATRGLSVKLDALHDKMYWSERNKIKRSNLDGTNVEELAFNTVAVSLGLVTGLELDVQAGKIYFVDANYQYLGRANLDGSSAQLIYHAATTLTGLAIDKARGKAYLSAYNDNTIIKINLDGSNPTTFSAGVANPVGLALDSVNSKLYIAGEASNQIRYCNLDGTNCASFSTGTNPFSIDLDLIDGKVYWILGGGGIYRANLNGTSSELLSSAATSLGRGIALDIDRDGDGIRNSADVCFNDPNKMNPGACGCGAPDTDTDGDGTANCLDGCPKDSRKFNAGVCGCGKTDLDANSNGVTDCLPEDAVQVRVSQLITLIKNLVARSNSSKRKEILAILDAIEVALKRFPSRGTDVGKRTLQSKATTASRDVKSLLDIAARRGSAAKFSQAKSKANQSLTAVSSLLASAR